MDLLMVLYIWSVGQVGPAVRIQQFDKLVKDV